MNKLFSIFSLSVLLSMTTLFANSYEDHDIELLSIWNYGEEWVEKGIKQPIEASDEGWEAVQPYLMPHNHPAKKSLDQIFSQRRPLLSSKNMKKAGFFNYTPSDKNIIVTGHPRLKGYLIKAYLDTCSLPEWKLWIQRIVGANQVRQSIIDCGYSAIMKAPKKWIYALPDNPKPPSGDGYFPKSYILVVQDMGIHSHAANEQTWHERPTKEFLKAFYHFVTINGLIDSYYVDNSPFCFDRKIAFLDTEHYNVDLAQFPNRQHVLFQFLSSPMRQYWEQLILNGGA